MRWGDVIAAGLGAIPMALVLIVLKTWASRRESRQRERNSIRDAARTQKLVQQFRDDEARGEELLAKSLQATDRADRT